MGGSFASTVSTTTPSPSSKQRAEQCSKPTNQPLLRTNQPTAMAHISEKSIEIVKATAPLVAENANKITSVFYPKMLGRNPELYKFFNVANQRTGRQAGAFSDLISGKASAGDKCIAASAQSKTLADAVVAYALNIDKLDRLSETVTRIVHKHCALGIQPQDYAFVHDNLMEAIGEVLGDAVTEEVAAAWSEAVMGLAKIFIGLEKDLYKTTAETQWTGAKDFKIVEIIDEANDIKSFRFQAADGQKSCPYVPGQYISVFESPQGAKWFAPRHYTVTSQPGDDYYQVTIKQLKGQHGHEGILTKVKNIVVGSNKIPDGIVSTYLHTKTVGDVVKLGPVFGPDLLGAGEKERAAAIVSVGVGITPTKAMLATALKERSKVAVFHGDANAESVAFRKEITEAVTAEEGKASVSFSYAYPKSGDQDTPFYSEGRLTGSKICDGLKARGIDFKEGTDYFVCAGPATVAIVNGLVENGADKKYVHVEFFGPFASL